VTEAQIGQLLACLKFIIDLGRVDNLLLNCGNRAAAVVSRISLQERFAISSLKGAFFAQGRRGATSSPLGSNTQQFSTHAFLEQLGASVT
jgi:hypothetical protein